MTLKKSRLRAGLRMVSGDISHRCSEYFWSDCRNLSLMQIIRSGGISVKFGHRQTACWKFGLRKE